MRDASISHDSLLRILAIVLDHASDPAPLVRAVGRLSLDEIALPDSAVPEVLVLLEEEFGLDLDDSVIAGIRTVGDLIGLVADELGFSQ